MKVFRVLVDYTSVPAGISAGSEEPDSLPSIRVSKLGIDCPIPPCAHECPVRDESPASAESVRTYVKRSSYIRLQVIERTPGRMRAGAVCDHEWVVFIFVKYDG